MKEEGELERETEGGLASPDSSASRAVATGNQAAASQPLRQRHAVTLTHSSLPPSLPPSLSKLYAKLQCIKAEIQDVNDEHVRSRQELEQIQNELTRELKFK